MSINPQHFREDEFATFIESLKLRHFTADEFLYRSSKPELRALWHPPEPELWPNIALTAIIADRLRHAVGLPMRVSSGYRPSAYNLMIGGTKKSQHQAFAALDLQVIGADEKGAFDTEAGRAHHRWLARLVREMRGDLFHVPGIHHRAPVLTDRHGICPFKVLPTWTRRRSGMQPHFDASQVVEFHGGVGSYATFVHIDTRGIDATWSGA